MISLLQYINERVKDLPSSVKGLIVFDIDDTLLRVKKGSMNVYKKEPGKKEVMLTTDEFAKDPDASDPNKRNWFDYRDFRDPLKVYNSIIEGTPLIRNLRIMDDYIEAGYDFCFLTARSCEDIIKKALDTFLLHKDDTGAMRSLGDKFKKTLSHAINDDSKGYTGSSDAEKKANILKKLCKQYDKVVFVDDDRKNVSAARDLKIHNLKVIKAWSD
jgi:FMN phosphatase YigB (HAD superfamily)